MDGAAEDPEGPAGALESALPAFCNSAVAMPAKASTAGRP
jgi:hypothetical protein